MKTITATCIILGSKNIGEADKMVFIYSKELGKLKTIAKGARKHTSKFMGHLETLNFCKMSLYFGPKNTIITEIISQRPLLRQRNKLETLSSAIEIARITEGMIMEEQIIEGLLPLLKQTISHLSKSQKPELTSLAYTAKLLSLTGHMPNFKENDNPYEKKYRKFFNFVINNPINEIENIKITNTECSTISMLLKESQTF